MVLSHDQWVSGYNTQEHWAHLQREDGRTSPAAVLGWFHGRAVSAEELATAFAPIQVTRRLERSGYVRFRHWRLYGERGLMHKTAAVWLTDERLLLTYSDEPLAQYPVTYARNRRQRKMVREERRFVTPFQSPQPPLWEPTDEEWLRVLPAPAASPRRGRQRVAEQPVLFALPA